jgi:SAM-dependent methyltransferase
MKNIFKESSKYYDLLYSTKEYDEESLYILNIIKKYSKDEVNTLLELGSGTGQHAKYLTQYNLEVFGIDLSSTMIEIAQSLNLKNFKIKQGDIRHNNFSGIQFDCAVSLFHVISYLKTNEDVIACFNAVNEQLKLGALFIFDVWYTPAVYTLKPETRVKRIENEEYAIVRLAESLADSTTSIVEVNFTTLIKQKNTGKISELKETHMMRHFSYNEMLLICELTGFEIQHKEEFMTGAELTNDSWEALFVLRKK